MGSFLNRKAHCTVNFPFAFHTVPTGRSNYCVVEPSTLHFVLLWIPSAGDKFVELVGSRTFFHVVHGTVYRVAILQELCHVFCFRCKSKSFLNAICRAQRIHAGGAEDPTLRKASVCADAQLTHAYIPAQPHAKSTINIITDHQPFSLSLYEKRLRGFKIETHLCQRSCTSRSNIRAGWQTKLCSL